MGKKKDLPKVKCCDSKVKCDRCPLRMLKEGTLPPGVTVHRRRVVAIADRRTKLSKKDLADVVKASRKAQKRSGKRAA